MVPAVASPHESRVTNQVHVEPRPTDLRELWKRLRESGDAYAREQLVLAHAPLVKWVAGRIAATLPPHVEEGDLISYGLVGLTSAVDRFDPDREVRFETYAVTRIRGAIIDELRSQDWVPRSVRSRAREIERTHSKLEHQLHRAPTDEEMADALDLSVRDFQDALLQVSQATVHALDELWAVGDASGDQVSLLDTIEDERADDPEQLLAEQDLRDQVADAIQRLPEREKVVIALYYYENLTLREIGEVLGVTESRASQLHTKAVLRLRSRLAGSDVESA
ncbi:RNA polymerase sigma factor WhiG [Patulibacter defluvii]|uniref:RNA polymerase sigma factor WhiG n=1 Tax=Patulibacter defluvii TaxID=3095358 RepID=UPI002A757960|nr:RNA polymerase sigma factor WhiG [Patulibacter sp. DM4]